MFRALRVVARNTFRHHIFAFDTQFSNLCVGTQNLSQVYTKYLVFASRVETINTKSGDTKLFDKSPFPRTIVNTDVSRDRYTLYSYIAVTGVRSAQGGERFPEVGQVTSRSRALSLG
jgi:hypothetical protein